MPEWFTFQNVAAVASILGAGAALWAAVNARGARQAAQAAQESARRRSLTEELSRLLQRSRSVASVLRADEVLAARYLADELYVELRAVCSRHAFEQPEGVRTSMLASQRYAAEIGEGMGGPGKLSSTDMAAVIAKADACAGKLADALGHCHAAVDRATVEETS